MAKVSRLLKLQAAADALQRSGDGKPARSAAQAMVPENSKWADFCR